ncbi:MAG: hypothetical protein J5669_06320 [Bacteroidales bacterium]|nr:hypothetical protein [Bacteroidales bacterium]
MTKKLSYLAPEAETFVVQAEGVICKSGDFGIEGFDDSGEVLLEFTPITL